MDTNILALSISLTRPKEDGHFLEKGSSILTTNLGRNAASSSWRGHHTGVGRQEHMSHTRLFRYLYATCTSLIVASRSPSPLEFNVSQSNVVDNASYDLIKVSYHFIQCTARVEDMISPK